VGVARGGLQLSDSGADLSECGGDIQYTSSPRHEDWERYWSANGERLIWQSWIAKYGEYINPGYLNHDDTALSESNVALPEDGPLGQIKDPPLDDSSKSKTSECGVLYKQYTAFHGPESASYSYSSTFQCSFQNSFPKDEQDLSKNIVSSDSLEKDVELPSKNVLDSVDDGQLGSGINKTELQGSFELMLPAITKTDAESRDENLLISPAGETPGTNQDTLMFNNEIYPADRWSPLSASSTDDSSGDGSADGNNVAASVANTALTSDSMTNVTKITVSSMDFSCGDTEDSVHSSSLSSSSAGSGSAPCVMDEVDQYWQDLWKQHFSEQYYAHFNAFIAWEQKEGNEETEASTAKTSDTSRPLFQVGDDSSSAKQNSFNEMDSDVDNVSASCIKDNIHLNFVGNYHSTNDIPLAVNAVVSNDYSYSGEIELALKCKSCCSKVEDANKEYERSLSCSCPMTVAKENLESTQTLSFEEDISGVGKMELSVGNDKGFKEPDETKEEHISEMFGNVNQRTLSVDDSLGFGNMELSPGTDCGHDESYHEKQCVISVAGSDMMVEDKEDSEHLYNVTDVLESPRITSTEPHLPPVPKRVLGRRSKSR
jgi:hypothetical protein